MGTRRAARASTWRARKVRRSSTLVDLVRSGAVDPAPLVTQRQAFGTVTDADKAFGTRQPGWIKVELKLAA